MQDVDTMQVEGSPWQFGLTRERNVKYISTTYNAANYAMVVNQCIHVVEMRRHTPPHRGRRDINDRWDIVNENLDIPALCWQ